MIHPDLDPEFLSLYDGVVKKVKRITGTRNDLFVMAGEGMLVLDSAVANLVEKGDQVLTISSGFYGDGLKEFVENYGGRPVPLRSADGATVSPSDVDRSLETPSARFNCASEDSDGASATVRRHRGRATRRWLTRSVSACTSIATAPRGGAGNAQVMPVGST